MSTPSTTPPQPPSFSSLDSIIASNKDDAPSNAMNGSNDHSPSERGIPSLTRAFSMPLPSQLGHLKKPVPTGSPSSNTPRTPSPNSEAVEVAQELADSVQMVIQTLLQISPPHLLDPAKEQFSACALQIPTPSISALLTTMKNLNYMSRHMPSLLSSAAEDIDMYNSGSHDVFDIGEVLQSVGDAVSGIAAEAGVEIVLFHSSVGLKHVLVQGDECGICYTLSHVVRQLLAVSEKGDIIEVQLHLSPNMQESQNQPESANLFRSTFEITHRSVDSSQREMPSLQGSTLQRLLRYTKASVQTRLDCAKEKEFIVELTFDLQKSGNSQEQIPPDEDPYDSTSRLAREPTLAELLVFVERLKGMNITFHASTESSFARHLTSYLTSWGMNVSHTQTRHSPERNEQSNVETQVLLSKDTPLTNNTANKLPNIIIIDDDISALRSYVSQNRAPQPYLAIPSRKRPSFGPGFRSRSTPFVTRAQPMTFTTATTVVVHFTSLTNYKAVKEVIQAYLSWPIQQHGITPEVIVIPKPAGPRRFLTALHTAVTKPLINPFFQPIATSPLSPSEHIPSPPFISRTNKQMDRGRSEDTINTLKSNGNLEELPSSSPAKPPLPSPLVTEEIEYFSESVNRLGNSGSTGVLVQSPDGRPAGIFFQPQGATSGRRRSLDKLHPSQLKPSPLTFSSPQPNPRDSSDPEVLSRSITPSDDQVQPESVITPRPKPIITQTEDTHASTIASETDPVINVFYSTSTRNNQSSNSRRAVRPKLGSRPKKGSEIVPPINVLIVEDNPLQQTILSTFMRRNKIRYGLANNGLEAVEKWRTGDYHLVLMDIQMPVMDGIQATQEIRRLESQEHMNYRPLLANNGDGTPTFPVDPKTPTTPFHSSVIIVALTASNLQSDRVAALAAGCNDFLVKPVALEWLEKKIIEWGSIKALQMWAENDVSPAFKQGQPDHTKAVAENLRIVRPQSRKQ